jgi:hypothetical protein
MSGMEAFTVGYLILFIALPVVLIGLFFGVIAWSLRQGSDDDEEALSTPLALED